MKRNILKAIAAICAVGIISGCSGTPEQTETTTAPAAEVTTTASEKAAETTSAPETIEETTTAETTAAETAEEAPKNDADIIAIAEKGFAATVADDYDGMIKYTNIDAVYYMASGVWLSDEQLISAMDEASAEETGFSSVYGLLEDLEFLSAEHLSDNELQEFNEFIDTLSGGIYTDYKPTAAYKLPVKYSNMGESEEAMLGTDDAPYMLVLEYDGEWKLDIYFAVVKDFYDSLAETEAEAATAETTAPEPAEEETEFMTIGDDSLGYMEIPDNWLTYFDPSTYGMNSIQYSSPDLQSIITMVSYDMTMVENGLVAEEQLSALDPYTLAASSYTLMTNSGYEAVETATVTLDGRSCYQVYGYLESGGTKTMLVAWYFTGDDGYTRYICFEAPWDISLEVCAYIEDSYRL